MIRMDGYRIRLVAVGVVFCSSFAFPELLWGQTGENDTDSTRITAAGPRLGPVVVVEVAFPNRDDLGRLARAGYDISNVQGNVATIYASLEELEHLKQTGYPLREIDERIQHEGFSLMALGSYHSYAPLTDELSAYAEANPDICRLYTLGQSVEGRELWAMLITDNPDDEEDEPEFKYVASMHGNEPEGAEMCLYFIDLLLTQYGQDDRITNLVNGTAIWIVPLMNPDGLDLMNPDAGKLGTRANANGIDLNRNFPLLTDGSGNIFTGEPLHDEGRQPEVRHIMNWTVENSFVLSAAFHYGSLLVCYPYGYNEQMEAVDTPTPDDLLFEEISRRYSVHNPPMWNNPNRPDGIINSAAWYPVRGEMADWNYRYVSCNEVTVELGGATAMLSTSQIATLWSNNSESMLSFLEAVHIGVRGVITDRGSGDPLWAEVIVEGNAQPVFTDPDIGDYHRMLLSGTYDLVFYAPGYIPRLVRDIAVTDGPAIRVDIELLPEQASPDFNLDRRVDIKDLLRLIEHWGQNEPLVDIAPLPDGDGIVDEQDVDLFMEYWQEEIPIPEIAPYLIAHWKLDETEGMVVADSVGDNNGYAAGDPYWQPDSGQVGGALEFDGEDDFISTSAPLNPADGPFSVFVWVKGGDPGQAIISEPGGADWLSLDPLTGHLMTELTNNGRSSGPLLSETTIDDGSWHKVGLVWDGSRRALYVDGHVAAEDTQVSLKSPGSGFYVGVGDVTDSSTFFAGLIDDIRIYNRAVKP